MTVVGSLWGILLATYRCRDTFVSRLQEQAPLGEINSAGDDGSQSDAESSSD